MTPLQVAAEALAERDMWNPADQGAIDKFTEAKARAQGLRPLFPMEGNDHERIAI